MGCGTSKPKVCNNCHAPYSPVRRSYSMHLHSPPEKEDETYHHVDLTFSTLGSLKLDSLNKIQNINHNHDHSLVGDEEGDAVMSHKDEFRMGMIAAKTWSQMINEKIVKVVPKTPIRTPPGEPETINAWELMEGLEDITPLKPNHHVRSFSFHCLSNPIPSIYDHDQKENSEGSKPLWLEMADNESFSNSNDTSIVSEFDPEVISTFRKSLEELPPTNPFYLKPLISDEQVQVAENKLVIHGKDKLIVFFTSLRGVRKTYEDCCHVRVILKGLGVKLDERDVSMHSGFKEELKELLEEEYKGGGLPRVFLGNKYIGGADEIRKLHEDGELEKVVEWCERVDDDGGGNGGFCEACGDIRFVPCETCSGSCKIYYEAEYDDDDDDVDVDEDELEEDGYGFQRCPDCNENGLIRCPICCD